jgi:hypothetical protein
VTEGQQTPAERSEPRASAPQQDGPLVSSGSAPAPETPGGATAGATKASEAAADGTAPAPADSPSKPDTSPTSGSTSPPSPADKPASPQPAAAAGPAGAGNITKAGGTAAGPAGAGKAGGTAAGPADAGKAGSADGGSGGAPTGASGGAGAKGTPPGAGAPSPAVAARARLLRRANPVRVVRRAGRSTSAWAKRPSGRLILPAIIAVILLGAAGTAGVYLVPRALQAASPSAPPSVPPDGAGGASGGLPGGLPSLPGLPGASGLPGITPVQPTATGARPADALVGWAQQVGTRIGIPVVAVQAYGYAELVVARTVPACRLSWTTLAAIAKVESSHGSANGAVLGADGSVQPPIYGLPLDGKGGRQEIRDTDQGTIDKDTTYDRAVGPLQFIPATWLAYKVDADNNGVADPNDIDDASLTAATYLCQGGRDMSKADSWWDAILSYNAVRPYAQKVFDAANEYGQRSRM